MIAIVRMQSQGSPEAIWDHILNHKDELQANIRDQGQLLYLSKRAEHEDTSLFVHSKNLDFLGDFLADHLGKIEALTGIWVIDLLRPKFFPLPKDTSGLMRFAITLRVFPRNLGDVYGALVKGGLPPGLGMVYVAFTYHLFGDCMQFSVLANQRASLNGYLTRGVRKMPGVLRVTVNEIEKTVPLVAYEEWKAYSSRHTLVESWDEECMLGHFRT
jgi:hypothetical protein